MDLLGCGKVSSLFCSFVKMSQTSIGLYPQAFHYGYSSRPVGHWADLLAGGVEVHHKGHRIAKRAWRTNAGERPPGCTSSSSVRSLAQPGSDANLRERDIYIYIYLFFTHTFFQRQREKRERERERASERAKRSGRGSEGEREGNLVPLA